MSNTELGERIGVSPSMASRIRNGHRLPGTQTLHRIHQAFGIPLDDLMAAHSQGATQFGRLLSQHLSSLKQAA